VGVEAELELLTHVPTACVKNTGLLAADLRKVYDAYQLQNPPLPGLLLSNETGTERSQRLVARIAAIEQRQRRIVGAGFPVTTSKGEGHDCRNGPPDSVMRIDSWQLRQRAHFTWLANVTSTVLLRRLSLVEPVSAG